MKFLKSFKNPFNKTKKIKPQYYDNSSSGIKEFQLMENQIPDDYDYDDARTSYDSNTSLDYPGDSEYIIGMDEYLRANKINAMDMDFDSFKKYNNDLKVAKMQERNKITKEKIESRYPMSFGKVKDCSKMNISVIKSPYELHSRYHACNCPKQIIPSKKCKEIKNKFDEINKEQFLSERDSDYSKIYDSDGSVDDEEEEDDDDRTVELGGSRRRRRKTRKTRSKRRSTKKIRKQKGSKKTKRTKRNRRLRGKH